MQGRREKNKTSGNMLRTFDGKSYVFCFLFMSSQYILACDLPGLAGVLLLGLCFRRRKLGSRSLHCFIFLWDQNWRVGSQGVFAGLSFLSLPCWCLDRDRRVSWVSDKKREPDYAPTDLVLTRQHTHWAFGFSSCILGG